MEPSKELIEKAKACQTAEELLALAKEIQGELTMEFTKELIEKAKACRTAEELLAIAKENEIELTEAGAKVLFEELKEGELADAELDNVSGGAEGCKPDSRHEMVYWEREEDVQFLFNVGDILQAFPDLFCHHTATVKVVNRKIKEYHNKLFSDMYWLEKEPGVKTPFIKGWYPRDTIEK